MTDMVREHHKETCGSRAAEIGFERYEDFKQRLSVEQLYGIRTW